MIEGWKKIRNESFVKCTDHKILLEWSSQGGLFVWGMQCESQAPVMCTKRWKEYLKGRSHLEDIGIDEFK